MKKTITSLAAALTLAVSGYGQLFTYDFATTTSGSPSGTAGWGGGAVSNLTFSAFTASFPANNGAGGVWSFGDWGTGATTGSDSFTGGIDLEKYYQFTITPDAAFQFNLSSITLDAGRSGTGPRQFVVRSNVDGFVANLDASASNANVTVVPTDVFQFGDNASTAIYSGNTITLTGGSFTDLSSVTTFRIYAFNAESAGGTFRVDNVAVNGSVTAIPEPSTYAVIMGVLTFGFIVWRRRQKA